MSPVGATGSGAAGNAPAPCLTLARAVSSAARASALAVPASPVVIAGAER